MTGGLLRPEFFDRPVLAVAPDLLGCVIKHRSPEGTVAVRLTEVEAYDGANDPGSHAYRGRTPRNDVMFGPPGHVYVYFTYGMHWCMNMVCGEVGRASAVLLRAGQVVAGAELARQRRPSARTDRELARGPARLTMALGLDGKFNGADACSPDSPLRICRGDGAAPAIESGPRVGLTNGAVRPWRFWLDGDPTVSVYRPAQPRRRRTRASGTLVEGAIGDTTEETGTPWQ